MKNLIILFVLLFAVNANAADVVSYLYTLDFNNAATEVEQAPDACTVEVDSRSAITLTADCQISTEGADKIFVCYDSVSDVLATHASADWDVNIRTIAESGDSYPTTGTDPTDTTYFEKTGLVDGQYGCFDLTPGMYAMKVRVDENGGAQIAAPTVKVKVEWKK